MTPWLKIKLSHTVSNLFLTGTLCEIKEAYDLIGLTDLDITLESLKPIDLEEIKKDFLKKTNGQAL